jgi:N-acetylmuramoyl-L-alanine amidase
MSLIKIVIDPGHGGEDWGLKTGTKCNKGYDGCLEKNINLEVANRFAWFCAKHDISYIMTRYGDRYISLKERCYRANPTRAFLFISIHCNYSISSKVRGLETWYYRGSYSGGAWASKCQFLLKGLEYTWNRGKKAGRNFYVLKHTRMPAILVELGFLSNPEDCKFLNSENNQDLIAEKLFELVRTL